MVLTSLRSGKKVARTSRLARRWISNLIVDSSLPKVASLWLYFTSSQSTFYF
jgi:hypothetical protein